MKIRKSVRINKDELPEMLKDKATNEATIYRCTLELGKSKHYEKIISSLCDMLESLESDSDTVYIISDKLTTKGFIYFDNFYILEISAYGTNPPRDSEHNPIIIEINENELPSIEEVESYISYNIGLCKGRHELPVKEYVYEKEINPTDIREVELWAYHKIDSIKSKHINLYATGLTVATLAVVNACVQRCKNLTIMHYDRDTNSYYSQEIKTRRIENYV